MFVLTGTSHGPSVLCLRPTISEAKKMARLHLTRLGRSAVQAALVIAAATGAASIVAATVVGSEATGKKAHEITPIDPTCTSGSPCIEYDNNGTGPAIRGTGLSGNGIVGITKNNSTSSSNGKSAVAGTDLSAMGSFNVGVNGFSTRGIGVAGGSIDSNGVRGSSTNATAVFGGSTNGIGVFGSGATEGVRGRSVGGIAVNAISSFIGANVTGGALGTTFEVPALSLVEAADGGTVLMEACSSGVTFCFSNASEKVMELESSGSMFLTGEIFTGGSCSLGCSPTTNGKITRIISYAPTVSQPTREDYGEAQLVNGQAYVRLDPRFANVIDQATGYLVFLTPEGPSQGLYVAGKSMTAFAVRENPGGHATIAFQYRIVARPYGVKDERLPIRYYQKTLTR